MRLPGEKLDRSELEDHWIMKGWLPALLAPYWAAYFLHQHFKTTLTEIILLLLGLPFLIFIGYFTYLLIKVNWRNPRLWFHAGLIVLIAFILALLVGGPGGGPGDV